MPVWVEAGFEEFARRMPREVPLRLIEVKAESRTSGKSVEAMQAAEAVRIEQALPAQCHRVILDEHGRDMDTLQLADRLQFWKMQGRDVAFIVGGPDGLSSELKASAAETLRLSSLTLPHALVRPLLAEAIYRAWTVLRNHPYHRE